MCHEYPCILKYTPVFSWIMRGAHVCLKHHAIFSKWIAMTISAHDDEFSQRKMS